MERIDLSEDSEFFLDLLESTHVWHERLVSELRFGSRNHVRVISSYQIDFPPALLDRYDGMRQARRANVLLPLTTRPKRQLLNFSLSGPEGSSATLTSRVSIAALQAQYLMLLAKTSTAEDLATGIDSQLYESICVFTPEFFQNTFLKDHGSDMDGALARYLSGGLGWNVLISDVERWRKRTVQAGKVLAERLGEPRDSVSSSEEVLLAIPHNSKLPTRAKEIDDLVDGFCDGVAAADDADDAEFLVALAEYGRRYELVVEVEVPLLEPSRIKVEEDVPLELKLRGLLQRPWVSQAFPLGDARSAHLEARVDDPNVEVADYEVKDQEGVDASGWLESVRHTREALAIYGSDPERPRFATLWLRLSVTRPLTIGALLLSMANVIAMIAIFLIDFDGSVGDRLAVLVIPTTIAATFALVREQTALAARLQWIPRLFLTVTTAILWLEVVAGLILLEEGHPRKEAGIRPGQSSELIGKRVSPLR